MTRGPSLASINDRCPVARLAAGTIVPVKMPGVPTAQRLNRLRSRFKRTAHETPSTHAEG